MDGYGSDACRVMRCQETHHARKSRRPAQNHRICLGAALNSIEPLMFELTNVNVFARDEEWAKLRKPSLYEFLGGRLDRLSAALGDKDYLEGDFAVGDLAMATVLRIADGTELVSGRPRLAAYQKRCLARPAFQRALDAQLATFKAHPPKKF